MTSVAHVVTSAYSHKILIDKLKLLQEEKGYDIEIISSKEGYNEELMSQYNFKLRFIYMNRKIHLRDDIISLIKLYRLFKSEKYDIVHTHTAKAGILGRIAAWLARVPVIIHTSHGLPYFEGQPKYKYYLYKFFEKAGTLFCDGLASQNKEDMQKIKKNSFNFNEENIFYEGNGVDLPYLDKIRESITEKELEEIQEELGIEDVENIILVGARFEPVKNHFYLLRGLKILKEKYKQQNFVCLLAGEGYLEDEIRGKIKYYNLEEEVKIIGYKTDIYKHIKLADIIALTSIKEGIPRIIMEGMAFSKPVIATDVLGTRELVEHGSSGFLVNIEQEQEFANFLRKLLTDNLLKGQLGNKGRIKIENDFTEKIVVNRINDMYEKLF